MMQIQTNRCVLYAEDDENDALIMKRAFKSAHISKPLHIVTNGQQAIDYLSGVGPFSNRAHFPLPEVVLLDLKMPHKTGMEVLEWIRYQSDLRRLVVIMYTSSHHETDIERAYEVGVNSFVVKPSDLHHIVDFAHALKLWWLDRNQCAPLQTALHAGQ